MHEMGIAGSILEAVERELRRYPQKRAAKVGLRIGEFAGVDSESLRFCFEALVKGSEFEPLELEIEWTDRSDDLDLAFLELEDIVGQGFQSGAPPGTGLLPGMPQAPNLPTGETS